MQVTLALKAETIAT